MTTPAIPTLDLRTPAGAIAIPLLGLGTWQSDGDGGYRAVRHALDVGYRHVDTATGYGNEDQVGRAVADSGLDRADVFLTTKLPPEAAGRERETLEQSLRLLRTDYVDLWLVHCGHAQRGVAVEGYSPLKRTDAGDALLTAIAETHGVTVQQVILLWHLRHRVVVIPKSTRPDRIEANIDILGFTLSDEEIARIDGLSRV